MDKDKAFDTLRRAQSDIATIIAQVERSDWSAAQHGCFFVSADLDDLAREMEASR